MPSPGTQPPRAVYLLRFARTLGVCLLATVLWAAEKEVVKDAKPPATSAKPANKKHRPMQKLKNMGEKVLTPHPDFQNPSIHTMPPNAPVAPKLVPEPEHPSATPTERFLRGAAKVMTTTWKDNIFVWLPALSTDPNTGPTYGILPVWVISDPKTHNIRHLIAPSYTYNKIFGQTVTGRYYLYPTPQSQLFAIGSYSTHTNREAKLRYEDAAFLGGRAFIRGEGYYDADGSLRFFGVGPNTRSSDEAGYTGKNRVLHADMGVNFLQNLRASLGVRYRRLETDTSIVEGITDLETAFPSVANQPTQNVVVQEFHLLWDSRDFPATPSKGSSGELFYEKTTSGWGSDADYSRYGVEGKKFFPWMEGKQNTVIHGLYDWAHGSNIPFYELATLGGRDTLRGFGEGRFSDQGRILFNIEQRMELTSITVMGVVNRFEVGPFFDMGTVFPTPDDIMGKNFQPVVGGFFRAVVKPNVVGSIDVGFGREGVGTYVSISYPF